MELPEYDAMRRVEETHWWFRGRLERALALLERFGIGGKILDLGCGTGANARGFATRGEVYAMDVSPVAARFTRDRGCARVAVGDALRIPFASASFDAVLAFDLFEHLADDLGAVREVRRVLRPNGVLLATVPACPPLFGPHDRALHHFRRYGMAEWQGRVRRAGFRRVLFSGYFSTLLFPVLLAWRALQNTVLRGHGESDVGRGSPAWLNGLLLFLVRRESSLHRFPGSTILGLYSGGPHLSSSTSRDEAGL